MSFISEIRLYPLRFVKTLALFFAMFVVGMAIGVIGPTMLDLTIQTQSNLEKVGLILPARGGGHVTGSFITGVLYSKLDYQFAALFYLGFLALIHVGISFCSSYPALIGTFFADGLMSGLLEAGATIFLIDIWGKENPPFMQAFNFCFGLGSFVVPLIAKPFLLPLDCLQSNTTIGIRDNSSSILNLTDEITYDQCNWTPEDVLLITPYSIIAGIMVTTAVSFLLLFIFQRETTPHPSRAVNTNKDGTSTETATDWHEVLIVVITSTFTFFYYGLEITFGSFLTTYAVNCDLKLEKATGALITSVFWGLFTFFRILVIVYIEYTGAEFNLYFELALIMIANIILIPFSATNEWALWLGSAIMGIGTSSVWATVFGFLEDYFPVKSHMTAAFIVSACAGEFVVPAVISNYVQIYPSIFLWVMLVCTVAMIILMSLLSFTCRRYFKKVQSS